jgi:hypothetical protein
MPTQIARRALPTKGIYDLSEPNRPHTKWTVPQVAHLPMSARRGTETMYYTGKCQTQLDWFEHDYSKES